MSYLKKLIVSLKEVFITYILGYILIIVASLIYTWLGNEDLTHFLNNTCSYLLILYYLLIIIYLYHHNKKEEPALAKKAYFPLVNLGISLAIVMNMLIFKIFPPKNITTIPFLLVLISSGIIGPIYEEIIFRYCFLNKLKKFNSTKKALIINTLIFALIHLSPIKIIYAFILGIFLNISYEKHNNILAPILIHISANTIVLFLRNYNSIILILATICLTISLYLNFKPKRGKSLF